MPEAEWYDHDSPDLHDLIEEVNEYVQVLAIDTETTGLGKMTDYPLFWSLSWGERRLCLDATVLHRFKPVFENPNKTWVFANAKFDMHMCANRNIHFAGDVHDTQVMHALLYEEKRHGLKEMAKDILGWGWAGFPDTFKIGKGVKKAGFATIQDALMWCYQNDRQKLIEYASNDAYGTFKIYLQLMKELKESGSYSLYSPDQPAPDGTVITSLWDYFTKFEVDFTKVLWDCERNGLLIDTEYLTGVETPVSAELDDLEREIVRLVGHNINPNSTEEMRRYFFEEEGITPKKLTKGGKTGVRKPCLDESVLEQLAYDHPVARAMLKHRDVKKLLSTYVEGLFKHIGKDGRIHPRMNQDIARTGRLSSADPNCFHPSTEVLTEKGWVAVRDLQQGVPVAQWDNGIVTFVEPTAYQHYQADQLVWLRNQHIRLAVTPDHRCLLRHRKTGALKVFPAADYPEDWQQLNTGLYMGGDLKLDNAFLGVLLAVQADGHFNGGGIDFSFKKERKWKRLITHLESVGAKHTHSVGARGRHRIRISASPFIEDIAHYLGQNKEFGPWLLQLCRDNLSFFCEEISFWDGCWATKANYSSDNYTNAAWVQTILSLQGRRSHLRQYIKTNGGINWQVDHIARDCSMTTNIDKRLEEYGGHVYCLSVPSSYVLVRFEGQICVTGQCQNIPNPERDKHKIREAFIAPEGYTILCADYDQLEMKLLACASGEPGMIANILQGRDIHMGNAALVFGPIDGFDYDELADAKKTDKLVKNGKLPKSALTDRHHQLLRRRLEVKTIGFGLNYGMKEKKLGKDLDITTEEAQELMQQYMEAYPAISAFFEEAVGEVEQTGYAWTILGRRRYLPDILSSNRMDQFKAERQAVNTPIQGSAADIVKCGMLRIWREAKLEQYGCRMLLQVHDELVFECPEEAAEEVRPIITHMMENPLPTALDVPMTISMGQGRSWGDTH